MLEQMLVISGINAALAFVAGFALAADEECPHQQTQVQNQEGIYDSQLMMRQNRIGQSTEENLS